MEKGKKVSQKVRDNEQGASHYEREVKMLRHEIQELRDALVDIHWEMETFTRGTFDSFIGRINRILQKYEGK